MLESTTNSSDLINFNNSYDTRHILFLSFKNPIGDKKINSYLKPDFLTYAV